MKNKLKFRKSSIVSIALTVLIFLIFNLVFYKKMPDTLPTHWNIEGEADDYASKFMAMIGVHIFIIIMNIFMCFMIDLDPKNKNQNKTMILISKITFPCMMFIIYSITILYGFGKSINVSNVVLPIVGFLLIALGNYMPKLKRSYTIGVKIPWTLNSDENWRKTHRLTGFLLIITGLILIISPFIKTIVPMIIGFILITLIPFIYSFYLFKKGV